MDSPRGRIYQMARVADGSIEVNPDYVEHMDLCLACRACETACPSGVHYGKLIEAARAQVRQHGKPSKVRRLTEWWLFGHVLRSPFLLSVAGWKLFLYRRLGLQWLVRALGLLKAFPRLDALERLTPASQPPFFFGKIGKVFPAHGRTKHHVALLAGCIANVSFARLNEATVRVLQRNGCEVTVPAGQGCCGALHVHAGLRDMGREQARQNIEALENGGFDAFVTNAAGCGSVLKEYPELFEGDEEWLARAATFSDKVKDVNEFLASIDLNRELAEIPVTVTYQDSCHLLHGQKVRDAPRVLLAAVPGLTFKELPFSEICCGSAGIYNVEHTDISMDLLDDKMRMAQSTGADTIVTANPGCMLQLQAGVERHKTGQRVLHVVELLDEAYRRAPKA